MKAQLHYFYDAICGWCYGFSDVIQSFYQSHQEEMECSVYSGGMVRGSRVGPISEMAPYLKTAYKDVEERTGVKFGSPFLEELEKGEMVLDSIPTSRSLAVFKEFQPTKSLQFAASLQKGIYFEGHAPQNMDWQIDKAVELGLARDDFAQALYNPDSFIRAEADFKEAERFGVKGFPNVVLQTEKDYYLIARGYSPLESLESAWKQIRMKEEEEK
jgi:putative protein-disulfide isomerase